jgi:hypothetical protein
LVWKSIQTILPYEYQKKKWEEHSEQLLVPFNKTSLLRKKWKPLPAFWVFVPQLYSLAVSTCRTFVASYPQHQSPFIKKRLIADVREDLVWWRDLLPAWNGVRFFNDSVKDTISLFTDSSGFGIGGFHVANPVDPNLIDYSSIRVLRTSSTIRATLIRASL